jgi:hypothetical protein
VRCMTGGKNVARADISVVQSDAMQQHKLTWLSGTRANACSDR